jgi:tetratricopeptide (TPR) repeat protein
LAVTLVALVGCGWRTVQQTRTWKDDFTLWTHTLTVSPDCFTAHFNLGNYYVRVEDDEKAIVHYREAIRADPDLNPPVRRGALCLRRLGRVDEAIQLYKGAIASRESRGGRSWRIHAEYAGYLRSLGRLEEALAEYEAIVPKLSRYEPTVEDPIREIQAELEGTSPG